MMMRALAGDRTSRVHGSAVWLADFMLAPGRARELASYIGACAVSLALDTAVFLSLIEFAGLAAPLAGAIGYMAGLILNYAIAVRYVFAAEPTGKSGRRLLTEYVASGLVGIAMTALLIALATDLAGAPPLAAKAAAVAFTFVAVYFVRAAGVFAPRTAAET